MKTETKRIILTVLNFAIVAANFFIRLLTGNDSGLAVVSAIAIGALVYLA